jgi:hypothetical protein
MKSNLIAHLKSLGFIGKSGINSRRIDNATSTEIIDSALECAELTKTDQINDDNSIFVHSASVSLGAGRYPCISTDCRLDRAKELAQFAALYSDQVYIMNFLSDYQHLKDESEEMLRFHFLSDLSVFAFLQPLIEEGRVIPFTTPYFCPQCFAKESFGKEADRRFEREYQKLSKKFLDQISCTALLLADSYLISMEGPEELLEHGGGAILSAKSPFLPNSPRLKMIRDGQELKLTQAEVRRVGIHNQLASSIYANIKLELFTSQIFHTSFITDRPIHINILNAISEDLSLCKRNALVEKYLTTLVPFLDNIELKDLLILRNRECDSFLLFRQSLNRAIAEYKVCGDSFSERFAKGIYSDIISPQLAKLDLKVTSAKRDLVKSSRRKTLAWAGAISFGIYAGFMPTELAAAATALGLSKIVADLLETVMIKSDGMEAIRNEEMYFLWKVRQLSKK